MEKTTKHLINKQLASLLEDEDNLTANLSNASALLYDYLENVNWLGFYLWDESDQELILGPFQGKVACVRIENGKGVCGTAFKEAKTILVEDVHQFPGHIACDAASQSEIVVPITQGENSKVIGVLDIDSPNLARFTDEDKEVIEEFAQTLSASL